MSVHAECSRYAIESLETGRLKLSPGLGFKISQATGVDYGWLMSNDESLPMVNAEGRDYTMRDFELAQSKDLESLRFYRVEPKMEIDIAADLLHRTLAAAHARDLKAVSDFQKRLEWFVRSEISRFRDLQDDVYQEIRQWGEENVGEGKSYPKTLLFPRSVEVFKRARRRADEAMGRKKRLPPIKK